MAVNCETFVIFPPFFVKKLRVASVSVMSVLRTADDTVVVVFVAITGYICYWRFRFCLLG